MAPPSATTPRRPEEGAAGRPPRGTRPIPVAAAAAATATATSNPHGQPKTLVEKDSARDRDSGRAAGDTPEDDSPTAKALRAAAQDVQEERDATSAKLQEAAKETLAKNHPDDENSDNTQGDEDDNNDAYADDDFDDTTGSKQAATLREAAEQIGKEESHRPENAGPTGDEDDHLQNDKETEDPDLDPREPHDPEDTRPMLSEDGNKTLLRCAFHGDVRRAETLLQQEAGDMGVEDLSVNGTDRHGWTSLHWAAARCHAKFCEFLLQHGAQLHARENTNGWTPLHLAAVAGSRDAYDVAELLIASGASRRVMDRWGDIPHEIAPRPTRANQAEGAMELRKLLRPESANP